MKLYYSPGACSLGIHIVLEETGAPYDTQLVSLKDGAQHSPAYLAVNPKAKVPALQRDDGSILTEYAAIATFLARTHPQAGLLPTDPDGEARAMEAMDFIVGTVHANGFTRVARPGNFSPDPAGEEAAREIGRENYRKGLALLDGQLQGRDWLAGSFSVADTALFYVSNWSPRADRPLPPNVARHFAAMKARPAVQRAMAAEGLS